MTRVRALRTEMHRSLAEEVRHNIMGDKPVAYQRVEHWRRYRARTFELYGHLQHPEVLRVSRILDQCVLQAQREAG